jgi:hypothetical protein
MLSGIFTYGSGAAYPFEAFTTVPVADFLGTHGDSVKLLGAADSTSKVFLNLPLSRIYDILTVRYGTRVYSIRRGMIDGQFALDQALFATRANAWLLTKSEFSHVVWGEVAGYAVPPFPTYAVLSNDPTLNVVYNSDSAMLLLLLPHDGEL